MYFLGYVLFGAFNAMLGVYYPVNLMQFWWMLVDAGMVRRLPADVLLWSSVVAAWRST